MAARQVLTLKIEVRVLAGESFCDESALDSERKPPIDSNSSRGRSIATKLDHPGSIFSLPILLWWCSGHIPQPVSYPLFSSIETQGRAIEGLVHRVVSVTTERVLDSAGRSVV